MPSIYISFGGGAAIAFFGGSTTFDVHFALDGTISFSYTKCNTLSLPDLSAGVALSIGIFGNKQNIPGESYVISAGASLPGIDISAEADFTYNTAGDEVVAMGASFGFGVDLNINPISASCSNCETKMLGCVTTLDEMGLGYLM